MAKTDKYDTIGGRLSLLEDIVSVTGEKLSEVMGLPKHAYQRVKAGERRLRRDEADRLADLFGVPTLWLIDGDERALLMPSVIMSIIKLRRSREKEKPHFTLSSRKVAAASVGDDKPG
jgi:transcriptional regulator with XRE-family HTH domain